MNRLCFISDKDLVINIRDSHREKTSYAFAEHINGRKIKEVFPLLV
jgi:hypothetical protein